MKRLLLHLTTWTVVGSFVVATPSSAGETAAVQINEVMPHSGDRGGATLHDWLELVNTTAREIAIAGWSIDDRDGNRYELPAALPPVPPGAFVVVHFDGAGGAEDDLDFTDDVAVLHTAPELLDVLDDDADHVSLRSSAEDGPDRIETPLVDFVAYGGPPGRGAVGAVDEAVRGGLWRPHGWITAEIGFGARFEGDGPVPGRSIGIRPGAVDGSRRGSLHDWSAYDDADVTPGAPNPVPRPYASTEPDGATLAADGFALGWSLVPGSSYVFQLDDDPSFGSPLVDLAIEDTRFVPESALPPGDYWWRVRAIVADTADGLGSSAWSPARRVGVVAAPSAGRKGVSRQRVLNITWLRQRKDTELLCIDGDAEGKPSDPPPKLTWDAPHPSSVMPNVAIHGRNHCVRASIAMVVTNYGGNLSQDRISYELLERQGNPIENVGGVSDPTEDLGHDRTTQVCGLNGSNGRTLLAWALGVNANAIVYGQTRPSFSQIRAWIDAGRPVIRFFFPTPGAAVGHVTVIGGYRVRKNGAREVRELDPWSGQTWELYNEFYNVRCHYVAPASAPNVRSDEAAISLDSDGDGVMDWDEQVRFGTDPLSSDSDFDGVPDKLDIRGYVFDSSGVYSPRLWDVDNDNFRKELDPDNDGDGDVDGCEDRNHNGKYEPSVGETDNFSASSSHQQTDSSEPNDSDAAATQLAAGTTDAYLTPRDRDFYEFATTLGTHVYLRVRYGDHTPGFRVRARLDGIAAIDAKDGVLELDRSFIPPGRHVLEIFGEDSRTRSCYTIDFGTADAVLRPWHTLPDPPLLRYLVPWRGPLVATYPWNPEIIDQYRQGTAADPLPPEFAVFATLQARDLDVYLRAENGRTLDFALFDADGSRIAAAAAGGRPRDEELAAGVTTSDGHIRVRDLPAGTYVISIGPGDFETSFELGVGSAALDVGFSPDPVSSPDPSLAGRSPQIVTEVAAGELGRAEVYVNLGSRLPAHGVKGWSLGIELEGEGEIVEVGTEGTAAEPFPHGLLRDGRSTAQPIESGRNEGRRGVVAAAVLGIGELATLPRVGTESILRLVVESTRPQGPEDQLLRLRLIDGLVGEGEPVGSVFTVRYSSERPANLETAAVAVRFVREPTRGDAYLGFSGERISSQVPFEGVIGSGLPDIEETELVVPVVESSTGSTSAYVNVVSQLGPEGSGGIVGWSIGLGLEGEAEIVSATTVGTTAALPPDGIRAGFELTQFIDPARNGGRRGVISAVVLFDLDAVSLPLVGTESILEITLESAAAQGSADQVATLSFRDDLVGSGMPTRTVLTIDETSRRAANLDEAGLTVRFVESTGPIFWRGDTNPDDVLDITDAIVSLGHQFLGRPTELECEKSADFNDDNVIDVTDPISLLQHMFLGGSGPRAPYPECGLDPTEDDLDCERFSPCER